MNNIYYKDLKIKYIYKKTLKNTYIGVSKDLDITIKTPSKSTRFIDELIQKKELWIRKQILKIKQNPPQKINLEDEVLLFGEICSLDIDEAKELREFLYRIRSDSTQAVLRCYDRYYKLKSDKYLIPRVEYWQEVMSLRYDKIKFKKMKSMWGNCSSKKTITLNTQLIKIKKELIDYVIVHELAHLVHMNHSKDFHTLVEKYLPHAKLLRKELKNINLS